MYVAEMSCNHNGDFAVLKTMIREASFAGADVVKIQLFEANQMTHKRFSDRYLIPDGLWKGRYLYDLYHSIRTPHEWLPHIQDLCDEVGVGLMVSVFSPETIDYCESHDVKLYKVASPEVGYRDLIDRLADKCVFVSTGLADESDLDYIKETIPNCTYLHCVSKYPANLSDCNLYTLLDMQRYGPVGLSDHTTSLVAPVVAIAFGAVVIEKHFKVVDCPDAAFSLFPTDFKAMVDTCNAAKSSLGKIFYPGGGRYKRQMVDGKMVRVVE